jgi:hypothetical protein
MTACAILPNDPPLSDILLHEAQFGDGAALPIAGWSLHQRVQPNGRAVIEIKDDSDDLVGLITSMSVPMLTVDAAWRGWSYTVDGRRRWWALAIGHASTNDEESLVTFTRRIGPRGSRRLTVTRPSRVHGLWIAAAAGLHTSITYRQGAEHRIRRVAPVPRLHARA